MPCNGRCRRACSAVQSSPSQRSSGGRAMKRAAVAVLMLALSAPVLAQQAQPSTEERLRRLEREVESLQFAAERAEQQALEVAFMLAAQGVARYEVVRYVNPG